MSLLQGTVSIRQSEETHIIPLATASGINHVEAQEHRHGIYAPYVLYLFLAQLILLCFAVLFWGVTALCNTWDNALIDFGGCFLYASCVWIAAIILNNLQILVLVTFRNNAMNIYLLSLPPALLLASLYFQYKNAASMSTCFLGLTFVTVILQVLWWRYSQNHLDTIQALIELAIDPFQFQYSVCVAFLAVFYVLSSFLRLVVYVAAYGIVYKLFNIVIMGYNYQVFWYGFLFMVLQMSYSWTLQVMQCFIQILSGNCISMYGEPVSATSNRRFDLLYAVKTAFCNAVNVSWDVYLAKQKSHYHFLRLVFFCKKNDTDMPTFDWVIAQIGVIGPQPHVDYFLCEQMIQEKFKALCTDMYAQHVALSCLFELYCCFTAIVTGGIAIVIDNLSEPVFHEDDKQHIKIFIVGVVIGFYVVKETILMLKNILRIMLVSPLRVHQRNDVTTDCEDAPESEQNELI